VKAHPREAVFPGDEVFIVRLVLVPENNNAQNRHRLRVPD
jgi:hypothetical protein